ncbi:MAG: hydrogenase iron-sulfur subunit [Candidatus Geothermarchaeales archaeon]
MEKRFEPRVIVFCCNWCAYAGADLAGISRLQYPANVRIIRVMCSCRVEPVFILKAFRRGADGILVAGCHIGECHYIDGNETTEKRINNTMRSLESIGLGGRLRLEWVSASEGVKFSELMKKFTKQILKLGPNPIKEREKLREMELVTS